MSKEKQCKCCQNYWYTSELTNGLCPNCYDYVSNLEAKLTLHEQSNKVLNDQLNKATEHIGDLNDKLAEKETEIKSLESEISSLEQDLTHYTGEVFNLKDQLAEKEELHKLVEEQLKDMEKSKLSWENQYFTIYNTLKNYREVTENKLAEMTEKYNACQEARKLEIKFNQQDKAELKQQLNKSEESHHKNIVELTKIATEKDRKIEELKQQLAEYSDINNTLFSGLQDKCICCEEEHNQDKIEFAVEQLTQAIKNIKKCNYKDFGIMYQSDAIAVIDNQIKQLKEGK